MSYRRLRLAVLAAAGALALFAGHAALSSAAPTSGPPAENGTAKKAPPPRAIPGLTVPDAFPRACVDCHVNYPEVGVDARFSTALARWQEGVRPDVLAKARAAAPAGLTLGGKHPAVPDALGDVPRACLECHGKDAKAAPTFARLMHAIHLTGDAANHFMTLFQGECTHCHKLDAGTGNWSVPSAPAK